LLRDPVHCRRAGGKRVEEDRRARPLGPGAARTLYNLADALYPELPRDLAPAAERMLLHAGLGRVRRTRLLLLWLEWEPVLTLRARRRFFRLSLAERQAACARWRGSRFAFARRAWARLAAFVEDALVQSSDGA
jgi:hypothetical protein